MSAKDQVGLIAGVCTVGAFALVVAAVVLCCRLVSASLICIHRKIDQRVMVVRWL